MTSIRKPTRCGYCDRALVDAGDRFECPRCAPLIAAMNRTPWREFERTFAKFQRDAWKDREQQSLDLGGAA